MLTATMLAIEQSPTAIAKRIGLSRAATFRWFKGWTRPSKHTLQRLREAGLVELHLPPRTPMPKRRKAKATRRVKPKARRTSRA